MVNAMIYPKVMKDKYLSVIKGTGLMGLRFRRFNFVHFLLVWDIVVDAVLYHPGRALQRRTGFLQLLGVLRQTTLTASPLWGLHLLKRTALPKGHPSLDEGPAPSPWFRTVLKDLGSSRISPLEPVLQLCLPLSPGLSPSFPFPTPGTDHRSTPHKTPGFPGVPAIDIIWLFLRIFQILKLTSNVSKL